MAKTTYLRSTTLLMAMMAAAVVAVLVGYGSASAQDECRGDCEPPPSSPETATDVATSTADDAKNTDREVTTGANDPDDALDRALEELVDMPGGPPRVIAVVQRGNQREVHTSGVANLKDNRPMEADDHMRIASTAKAFSGAVALSLVSKGTLSLDDTIGERLPGLPDAWSEVTLRQLLNHTSGLPDFSQDPAFQATVGASLTKAPPPEKLLTYVYGQPLQFTSGSEYRYSNSENIAVALMVEEATGKTYENQLKKQVYRPLSP